MIPHKFTSRTKIDAFQLKDFLGVDFTTHDSEVNTRRSPDAMNMISGKTGSVDKRTGFKYIFGMFGKIWAMKTIKTYIYEPVTTNRVEIEVLIVHAGTSLYAYNPYLDTWQEATAFDDNGPVTVVLQERKTNFIDFGNQDYITIIQNNWINDRNDLLLMYCTANTLFDHRGEISFQIEVNNPDKLYVYYPTTSIARSPNGLTSTDYENPNLLVNIRKNSFLSNGTDSTFILDYVGNIYSMDAFGGIIEQMQSDGSFSTNLHNASGTTIIATYNTASHSVTFSGVPHATYITGQDNIRITFRTASSAIVIDNIMNDYQSYGLYGLSGSNDVLFLCNHYEQRFRNKEIWLRLIPDDNDETTTLMLYADKDNYSLLGTNRKLGYSEVGEYFILHGEREGSSPVAYLKTISLDSAGELIVSNRPTTSQIGAMAKDTFANLRDDPLFLSEAGVTAVVIDSITGIQSMQDRGFYINDLMLKEDNIEDSLGFVFDNKYFLIVGKNAYIADSRKKVTEKLSYSESFQYEWYYWKLPFTVSSYTIYNGKLYLGTQDSEGYNHIYNLKSEGDETSYVDEYAFITEFWLSSKTFEFGDIAHDIMGTYDYGYFFCIKDHSASTITLDNDLYWIPVTLHYDGETVDYVTIPVYAYWTTPVMNMGNMTVYKTLKNLWVRLSKYAHMSTRIYYSTGGLVKEEYDGIFDFSDVDFSQFTFSSDTDPSVIVTNRQQRKFMSIQFKIESRDTNPFSLLEIVGKYIVNKQYKG